MLLDRFLNVLAAADHAGGSAAQLNEVFAHPRAIEHGVEGRHLVDARGRRLHDRRHLVHGRHGKPPPVLSLGQIQQGDDAGLFVVGGIFGEDFIDQFVVLFGEVEVRLGRVVGRVDVLFDANAVPITIYYEIQFSRA